MEPTHRQLANLEKKAKAIVGRLNRDDKPVVEPVVVEFAGSPKAGKTTTIDIVEHFFRRMGFKVWAPTEGAAKRTPYQLRRDLVAFNTWTLNYAISEILVAYHNVDQHDLIILDRGPFDSLAWMRLLKGREEHNLSEEELEVFERFACHPRWSKLIARLYLFTCDPQVSLKRETESKLTLRSGTAMNETLLSDLLKQYKQLEKEFRQDLLKSIPTSEDTTPKATSFGIAEDLLGIFDGRVDANQR
ncbi:MAG: hypothetical protein V3W34_14305 [Phycisphaerae bacterium]